MKVVISAGGRFHAINLASQLQKLDFLSKLFSFSYTKSDKEILSNRLVEQINSCKMLDLFFSKFRCAKLFNRSVFNFYKDDMFDFIVSKKIKHVAQIDLFIGWSNYCLRTLQHAKSVGAKVVVEAGSCHILEQQRILEDEYDRRGIRLQPVYHKTITKMCAEYSASDYIMTLSKYSRNSFIKHGIAPSKVLQVSCGADVSFFLHAEKAEKKNKFRVIFVGLLCLRKGVQYLIEAWNKLNLPLSDAELILVGCMQKDFEATLKNFEINKNVIFYGSTDKIELRRLYSSSSVFVLPSLEDGFGMVLGEAMSCGIPVICTENVGAAEFVIDGENGFVVPAGNGQALAEKILWCYQHQDALIDMGDTAKKQASCFGWENYGKAIVLEYKKILGLNT